MGNSSTSNSATLTVGYPLAGGGTTTFGGVIQDTLGSGNQKLALTVGSGANLTLTGPNTYTGTTTISSGGLLQIGNGTTVGQIASQAIADAGSLVFNHADALVYSGTISGGGSLVQLGGNQLTLTSTANTWSGGTTISNGTLQIGDGAASSGSITGNITNNASLIFATPGALSYGSVISGSGGLDKTGAGTLTLGGYNTFTGGTTVNSGTLALGAAGGGTGVIRGTLTINPGAEVNGIGHDVFGYSGYATSLGTLNLNGGTLNQGYAGNETFSAVTVNMTGGLWSCSAAGGYVEFFTNASYGNSSGTVNTLPSSTTAVISAPLQFHTYNAPFNVSAGSTFLRRGPVGERPVDRHFRTHQVGSRAHVGDRDEQQLHGHQHHQRRHTADGKQRRARRDHQRPRDCRRRGARPVRLQPLGRGLQRRRHG